MNITAGKILLFACMSLILLLPSCAPKKIRIYDLLSEGVRGEVVQTALAQEGKKYRLGNRGPDYFDCSGLVYYSYRRAGILVPLTAEAQGRFGAEIPRNNVQPGDLVLFKIKNDDHVGIMLGDSDFIHASKSRGVAVDSINLPYWRRYLTGFRCVVY